MSATKYARGARFPLKLTGIDTGRDRPAYTSRLGRRQIAAPGSSQRLAEDHDQGARTQS